jgi:hypothetical protein
MESNTMTFELEKINSSNIEIESVTINSSNIGWIINTGFHYVGYYIYPANHRTTPGIGLSFAFRNKSAAENWFKILYGEDKGYWESIDK